MGKIREFKLPDGQIAILPQEWFARFQTIFSFGKAGEQAVRLQNYHFMLLEELADDPNLVAKEKIDKLPGKKLSILLEISPNGVFDYAHDDWFDFYMAIDPTKSKDKNIYIFPRPIEIMRKSSAKKG